MGHELVSGISRMEHNMRLYIKLQNMVDAGEITEEERDSRYRNERMEFVPEFEGQREKKYSELTNEEIVSKHKRVCAKCGHFYSIQDSNSKTVRFSAQFPACNYMEDMLNAGIYPARRQCSPFECVDKGVFRTEEAQENT